MDLDIWLVQLSNDNGATWEAVATAPEGKFASICLSRAAAVSLMRQWQAQGDQVLGVPGVKLGTYRVVRCKIKVAEVETEQTNPRQPPRAPVKAVSA